MKIYKIALSVQDAARVNQREKLAFKDLFAGNLRVIIPLQNNELLEMVNLLESGDTESETKYKVDIEHNLAYRIKDGELDPRPMRPGKVIKKELGQTWADEWSRQVNSTTNKNYSIILSRSPIDVARMSDHDQINSCHSPGESYFPNAIEEAKDGGAIAYVVDNEDVAEIAKAGLLQSEEIFEDRNRGVSGISPLSRIRINRYVEEDDDTIELAVPVTRSYGDSIAGFLESTTRWLYDKQQSIFDYKDLETDLKNFIRTGGAYADINDSKLFENFFGSNMGVRGDLESRAGTARVDMFNEEFHEIEDNIQLKHCQIGASAEMTEEGYLNIYASASIIFQIYGVPSEKNPPWQRQRKAMDWLKNNISITGEIEDMYFNFHEETGITSVEVRVFFDDVQSPDDFRMVADELERFDRNEYNTIFNGFLDVLIADNLISRQHVNFGTEDYENYFSEQGMVYDKDDKEIVLWITVPFDISEYFKSGEKEKLREIIEESFQAATKQRLKEYVDSPRSQQNYFEFVKNDPKFDSPLWRGMIPIPSFEIYFNTLMDNPSKFAIDIPDFEVMRLGKEYFDIYAQVLPFVVQDIVTAIQSDQFDRYEKYEEPIEINRTNRIATTSRRREVGTPVINMEIESKMLKAFMDQQKVDPKIADKQADLNQQALEERHKEFEKELEDKLAAAPPSLFKLLNLRTELKDGELNQKTIPHPKLAGYDHSLEQVRMKFKQPESRGNTGEQTYEVVDNSPPDDMRGEIGIDWGSLGDTLIGLS